MIDRKLTRRDVMKGLGLGAGAALAGCALPTDSGGIWGAGGKADEGSGPPPASWADVRATGRIEHVVVLCMENRSFDHYFGAYSLPVEMGGLGRTDIDGLSGLEVNPTADGGEVQVHNLQDFSVHDLPHEWAQVRIQHDRGSCAGFVRAAELHAMEHFEKLQKRVPESERLTPEELAMVMSSETMGYHTPDQLPLMYSLAEQSVLCEHWYSSVLGPTWTNRFFLHGSSSGGLTDNHSLHSRPTLKGVHERLFRWQSILDVMEEENGLSATNFFHDVAWLRAINPDIGREARNQYDPMTSRLDRFVAKGFFRRCEQDKLPALSIIDPHYGTFNPGDANDDHPDPGGSDAHDIRFGQMLIGSVVAALAQNPDVWRKTLLIITYDEHGGFYDHVPPPTVWDERADFEQLGFRVPSLVIGPYVRRGAKIKTQYEHVSILKTVQQLFGLSAGFDSENVQARIDASNDLLDCLDMNALEGGPHAAPELPPVELSLSNWRERRRYFADKGDDDHDHGDSFCFCPGEFVALLQDRRTPAHVRDAAKDGGALERVLEEGERLGAVVTTA
jgi:phospholipase C